MLTQHAGLVPAARTDELLGPNAGDSIIDTINTTMEESGSSLVAARMTTPSSSHVKPASKKRLARRNKMYYLEDDQFNRFLSVVATQSEDTELEKASKVAKLMSDFEHAMKHMKCPVKAAYFVSSSIQFLTPSQKRELKHYKKEIAEAEAEISSNEGNKSDE